MSEAVFRQAAQLEVLNQDIGIFDQVEDPRAPFFGAEVGCDGFLATIAAVEIGGRGVAVPLHKRRSPTARIVARRGLHLDDLCTKICKCLAGPGAGQNACQFKHA